MAIMFFMGFVFLQMLFLRILKSSKGKAPRRLSTIDEEAIEKMCFFCKELKEENTKHCDLCKTCVSNFDHHCYYIQNCVGEGNHYMFLSFLFNLIMMLSFELIATLLIQTKTLLHYHEKFDLLYQFDYKGVEKGEKMGFIDFFRVLMGLQLGFSIFCLYYAFFHSLGKWQKYYSDDENKKVLARSISLLRKVQEKDSWICTNHHG